ncbi:MAG: ATPase, T2SS/T4P/T4SS family [Armatimonadota bacterium]
MVEEQAGRGAATLEPGDGDLLTLADTIAFLGISKQTLYRMMEREEMKGIKVGRQWRFRKGDLAAFLQRGPEATALATAPPDQLDDELAFFAGELQRLGDTSELTDPNGWDEQEDLLDLTERKVAKLVNQIIALAIHSSASDIHLEPTRTYLQLRYRVDGVLFEVRQLPKDIHPALLLHLKNIAGMNAEERRIPQDGRLHFEHNERNYDLRINVLPTVYGENAVMRILDQSSVLIGMGKLGFFPDDYERLEKLIRQPSGMVLMAGPTGSGKTTTVYSCLNRINSETLKILTVEDPVEYALPGITQVAVYRKAGLTFPVAVRAFLRQDPDIIFAGEIRDLETAEILVQAALTGHLVFSTLHPESAVGTLLRLSEMGVEPFLITASLQGVVYQKLVRLLCEHCKQPAEIPVAALAHIRQLAHDGGYELPTDTVFNQAVGCEKCNKTGYRGRMGLYEVMEFTPALREAFLAKATLPELTALAVKNGMHTLVADGIRKAAAGLSTIEEVLRVAAVH